MCFRGYAKHLPSYSFEIGAFSKVVAKKLQLSASSSRSVFKTFSYPRPPIERGSANSIPRKANKIRNLVPFGARNSSPEQGTRLICKPDLCSFYLLSALVLERNARVIEDIYSTYKGFKILVPWPLNGAELVIAKNE